ncbi:MAG: hypothetical protein QY326_09960 [Bdellovibrionota bacterium]|nr:MAG: hypothetical protein QY326_09960 [Bdellovibrionota bacterium]
MASPITQNVAIGAASAVQSTQLANVSREGGFSRSATQAIQKTQQIADKATVSAEAKSKLKTTSPKKERLDGAFESTSSKATSSKTKARDDGEVAIQPTVDVIA